MPWAWATWALFMFVAAVEWNRKQHFKEDLHDQVMRGIKKDKGTSHKDKHTVTFPMMCDLTETLTGKKAGLAGLMRAVVYNQLGQTIQRGQSAVSKTQEQWDSGINLTVADVKVMDKEYAVAFGLKHQKQDHRDQMRDCCCHTQPVV